MNPIKKWLRNYLGLESAASPANEKVKSALENGSNFALHVYTYNNLIVQLIRIQGLEMTLEDIKKMRLPQIVPISDELFMTTWKCLIDLYKVKVPR